MSGVKNARGSGSNGGGSNGGGCSGGGSGACCWRHQVAPMAKCQFCAAVVRGAMKRVLTAQELKNGNKKVRGPQGKSMEMC
jgi:hypothetical protein